MIKLNFPKENKPVPTHDYTLEAIVPQKPIPAEVRPIIFSVSPAEKEVKIQPQVAEVKLHLWIR